MDPVGTLENASAGTSSQRPHEFFGRSRLGGREVPVAFGRAADRLAFHFGSGQAIARPGSDPGSIHERGVPTEETSDPSESLHMIIGSIGRIALGLNPNPGNSSVARSCSEFP